MPLERIVLSAKGRDQLIILKRRTGIDHWNVLCRWALCISLREPTPVPDSRIPSDSNIEMSWRTFGGDYGDLYWCLLMQRCADEGLNVHDDGVVSHQFRLHLHRGISYLVADRSLRNAADLVRQTQFRKKLKTKKY